MRLLGLFILFTTVCTFPQNITATLGGNTANENFIVFNSDSLNLLNISGEGNVGIGKSTPTALLDVDNAEILLLPDPAGSGKNTIIKSGAGTSRSGDLILQTNISGDETGDILMSTPGFNFSGDINISTGNANTRCGDINISTGGGVEGGAISLTTGSLLGAIDNGISLTVGDNPDGEGADVTISSGDGFNNGGSIVLNPGTSSTSSDGMVVINGSGTYTGTWTQTSDVRYKKDIKDLGGVKSKVMKLEPKTFYWKKSEFPEKKFEGTEQVGLIAQDVEKEFPEIVRTDEKGYKSIDYSKLSVLLLETVKEQQKQIDRLNRIVGEKYATE